MGVGDLQDPGLTRLLLVDLLLAHHLRQVRPAIIQHSFNVSNIKLDDGTWDECEKVLARDNQVDWVAAAQGMRAHPERLGGLLLLLRVRQVMALLREFVARGSRDNNSPNQVPMR